MAMSCSVKSKSRSKGRPPLAKTKRRDTINRVLVSSVEDKAIRDAADKADESISEYYRLAALRRVAAEAKARAKSRAKSKAAIAK